MMKEILALREGDSEIAQDGLIQYIDSIVSTISPGVHMGTMQLVLLPPGLIHTYTDNPTQRLRTLTKTCLTL